MSYQIALQFEDGVSRIIPCEADELVADAAYRAKINIPLDCRDGACGTCKCHCESGTYTMGEYIEDALAEDEAAERLRAHLPDEAHLGLRDPRSGLVGGVQDRSRHASAAELTKIARDSSTTVSFSLQAERPLSFLPGQYVNLQVPGSKETRSYSFSSRAEPVASCRS